MSCTQSESARVTVPPPPPPPPPLSSTGAVPLSLEHAAIRNRQATARMRFMWTLILGVEKAAPGYRVSGLAPRESINGTRNGGEIHASGEETCGNLASADRARVRGLNDVPGMKGVHAPHEVERGRKVGGKRRPFD